MDITGVAAAVTDPRFPPWWRFAGVGAAAGFAVVIIRSGFVMFSVFLVGALLGFLMAFRKNDFSTSEEVRTRLAIRAPLPGTIGPLLTSAALVTTSMRVAEGSWIALPLWAVIVIAAATGVAVALLARREELMRISGVRKLESDIAHEARIPDASARAGEEHEV